MPRFKVEFDAGWSPEKLRMVSAQLRRELATWGGVSMVSDVKPIDAPPEPGPPKLQLYCTANQFGRGRCTAEWESETFTECPNGHGRKWVHKGQRPQEVTATS